MATIPLLKSGSVAIGAAGTATIVLGPERGGESWSVTRIAVQCTSASQTSCSIYRDVISSQTELFGSRSGNQDVASGDPPLDIAASSRIIVAWADGTPGATATVVIEGKLTR